MAISIGLKIGQKQKGRLQVHEIPMLEVIYMTLTENSSAILNNTQGPQKYLHH